ncbi:MAG: hypothetical protein OSJ64_05075, partial [Firmicutes bacterium]|nr:hypothetical protein [Bacillota bacterium]
GISRTAEFLDGIKAVGYKYSTRAGITVGVGDILIPPEKAEIMATAEHEVLDIEEQYEMGLITGEERYRSVIKIWEKATDNVTSHLMDSLDPFNPIFMMANSGARGNVQQIRQLAGLRGLMADPTGRIIDLPIKANFREGLTVLEFFISAHGARKGLADTALRTADSGYLTRRLVDVAQDVIVREDDCGDSEGIWVKEIKGIARRPNGQCLISKEAGRVHIFDMDENKRGVRIINPKNNEPLAEYPVPYGSKLCVTEGQLLEAGDEITEGSVYPNELLETKGVNGVQLYLLQEVQKVYRMQGVDINDKHIEVIVRQMLKKVKVEDAGDTALLPGVYVDKFEFADANEKAEAEGLEQATASDVLLGITKASLATDSFLSAASFQETTRVLTDAAIKGKQDPLLGLKENVIIGKLIPAGTGVAANEQIYLHGRAEELGLLDEYDELFTDDLDDIDEGAGVLDADNDDGDIFFDAVYGDPDADYSDDDMD